MHITKLESDCKVLFLICVDRDYILRSYSYFYGYTKGFEDKGNMIVCFAMNGKKWVNLKMIFRKMWISLKGRINTGFFELAFRRDSPTFLHEMVDFRPKNARMEETRMINIVVEGARYRALRHTSFIFCKFCKNALKEPVIGH